jgi:hypothetical protein
MIFNPEDGVEAFLGNVGSHTDYTGDGNIHNYRCEDLKSYKKFLCLKYLEATAAGKDTLQSASL